MAATVYLHKVIDEMDVLSDEITAYLNRRTGELRSVHDDEVIMAEDDVDLETLPEWQRNDIPVIREILESEDWIPLPSSYEINEWSLMEAYSLSMESLELRDELLRSIQGKGAFRHFKDTIRRHAIEKKWYEYRRAAFEAIAIEWLEENEIPYSRELDPSAGV